MTKDTFNFTKEYRDLYLPSTEPAVIEIPPMSYIMIAGAGDPNDETGEYAAALQALYALTFTIKMSKMSNTQPEGYFEYKVPPLEALWWNEGPAFDGISVKDKSAFLWVSMIRQPDFVTPAVFAWACEEVARKKPGVDISRARFETYEEGMCVQIMHKGPYDNEPATIEKLESFVGKNGYENDFSSTIEAYPLGRRHHEVYLGDPRRTKPDNLRTVIRHPIRINS